MLSEEHLTELACSMVLIDILDKNKAEGHETAELKQLRGELQEMIDDIMKTLNQEEMNQVVERYTRERNNDNLKSLR